MFTNRHTSSMPRPETDQKLKFFQPVAENFSAAVPDFQRKIVHYSLSSIHTGAWSLLCSQPRTSLSTPAETNLPSKTGFSKK